MSFLYNAFKNAPAIGKKIKSTITGMKPTTGQKKTRDFKMGAGIKRLNKQIDKLQELKKK